jgi:DNA-binding PadR family transcriptional regulator
MARYLGEFEQALLLAVLRVGDGAYGLSIRRELEAHTGRRASHGATYVTLDRLVAKGLLESRLDDSTDARGGRRKRFFRVTPQGLEALKASRERLLSLWDGIEEIFEER